MAGRAGDRGVQRVHVAFDGDAAVAADLDDAGQAECGRAQHGYSTATAQLRYSHSTVTAQPRSPVTAQPGFTVTPPSHSPGLSHSTLTARLPEGVVRQALLDHTVVREVHRRSGTRSGQSSRGS